MTLSLRWKKPAESTIMLETEDLEGTENPEGTGDV